MEVPSEHFMKAWDALYPAFREWKRENYVTEAYNKLCRIYRHTTVQVALFN